MAVVIAVGLGASGSAPAVMAAAGHRPYLSALVIPSSLPADAVTVSALYFELVGANGAPLPLGTSTSMTLSSSDPTVATVPSSVRIPAGRGRHHRRPGDNDQNAWDGDVRRTGRGPGRLRRDTDHGRDGAWKLWRLHQAQRQPEDVVSRRHGPGVGDGGTV